MEKELKREIPMIFNKELAPLRGRLLIAFREPGHLVNYYEAKLSDDNQKCTACYSGKPVAIRHEFDHMGQQFYEAFCDSCIPPVVSDTLSSK